MVKDIVKDVNVLSQVAETFKPTDMQVIRDLLDTAKAHKDECAGLAAIQIGYNVKAFVVKNKQTGTFDVFVNPRIIERSAKTFEAEEGCLSLEGTRTVKRHVSIKIIYTSATASGLGRFVTENVSGFRAEVIRHEYDHLQGKLI